MSRIETLSTQAVDALQQSSDTAKQVIEASYNTLTRETEREEFIESMKDKIGSLDEKIREQINQNLEFLRSKTNVDTLRNHLDALVVEVQSTTPQEVLSGVESTAQRVGDSLENATEYVLPEKWTKNLSRGQKITIGAATGTVAIAAGIWLVKKLWNRGKKAVEKGQEEAAKSKGGFLKKSLIALGVGGLAFLGYKAYKLQSQYKSFKDMLADMKADIFGKKKDKKEVKLQEDEEMLAKAEEAYRTANPEKRADAVRGIFGLAPGETSPDFVEFMAEMDKKYEVIVKDTIRFTSLEVAKENMEHGLKSVLHQMEEYIEDHSIETGAIATALMYKAGPISLLKSSLLLGGSFSAKSVTIAAGMAKWGIKHPLLSLLMVGGGIGTKHALSSACKYAPESLNELVSCGHKNMSPALDNAKQSAEIPHLWKEHMKKLAELPQDFASLTKEHVAHFFGDILQNLPEQAGLEAGEIIMNRNYAGIQEFREHWLDYRDELRSKGIREQNKVPIINSVLEEIDAFEQAHLSAMTGESSIEETEAALKKVKSALSPLGVSLVREDGVLRWQNASGQKFDICVDPEVKDESAQLEAAEKLYFGESAITTAFFSGVRQLRKDLQESKEMYQSIFGWQPGDYAAMMIGETLYAVDLENPTEYIQLSGSLAKDMFGEESWSEWMGKHGKATAVGGMMMVSGRVMKKLAIGGGPLIRVRPMAALAHFTPGVQQALLTHHAFAGMQELDLFTRGLGYMRAREYNTVLRMAGLRPEMIHQIETGDVKALKEIAHKLHLKKLPTDPVRLQRKVKLEFIEALKKVQVRDFRTWKVWRWVMKGNYARDISDLYSDIAKSYAKRPPPKLLGGVVEVLKKPLQGLNSLKNSAFLRNAAKKLGVAPRALVEAMRKAGMRPEVAEAFAKSKRGAEFLARSFKAAGNRGILYSSRLGSKALQVLRSPVGKSVSRVGGVIGFEAILFSLDVHYSNTKIEETDNKEIQELYEDRKLVSAGTSGIGVGLGLASLASTKVMAAAGPVGWVSMPFMVAAGYSEEKITAATESWLKDADDWQKSSNGDLLKRMEEIGPGKQGYWQQAGRGTEAEHWYQWAVNSREDYEKWEMQGFRMLEDANQMQRFEMLKAYLAHQSATPQLQGESEADFTKRFAQEQMDKILFISGMTDGKFDVQQTTLLENAELHAEVMAASRDCAPDVTLNIEVQGDNGVEVKEFALRDYTTLKGSREYNEDGINRLMVIHAYKEQQKAMLLLGVGVAAMETPNDKNVLHNADFAVQHHLLHALKHDLARTEKRILEADLEGWEWTGGEAESQAMVRMILSNEFRKYIRKVFDIVWSTGADMTPEKFDAMIKDSKAWLGSIDPEKLYKKKERYFNSTPMADAHLYLDVRWLTQNLYVHPPA